jgi:hypothetical protein
MGDIYFIFIMIENIAQNDIHQSCDLNFTGVMYKELEELLRTRFSIITIF